MLIGIVQTFAVALDYSALDFLGALGVTSRVQPRSARSGDQDRAGGADHSVPAASSRC